jgi:hypothetical protein
VQKKSMILIVSDEEPAIADRPGCLFSRDGGLNNFLDPACGPGFLPRSGAAQFFVRDIKAADEFGIFRYRMGSSNQVALHLVAGFGG